MVFRVLPTKWN